MSRDPGLEALVANAKRKPGAPVVLPKRTATCIITNCRKIAPRGEPFCAEHR